MWGHLQSRPAGMGGILQAVGAVFGRLSPGRPIATFLAVPTAERGNPAPDQPQVPQPPIAVRFRRNFIDRY